MEVDDHEEGLRKTARDGFSRTARYGGDMTDGHLGWRRNLGRCLFGIQFACGTMKMDKGAVLLLFVARGVILFVDQLYLFIIQ